MGPSAEQRRRSLRINGGYPPGQLNVFELVGRLPWVEKCRVEIDTWEKYGQGTLNKYDLEYSPILDADIGGREDLRPYLSVGGFVDDEIVVGAAYWESVGEVSKVKFIDRVLAHLAIEYGTEGLHVVTGPGMAVNLLNILRDVDEQYAALPEVAPDRSVWSINQLLRDAGVEPAPILVSTTTIGRVLDGPYLDRILSPEIESVYEVLEAFHED